MLLDKTSLNASTTDALDIILLEENNFFAWTEISYDEFPNRSGERINIDMDTFQSSSGLALEYIGLFRKEPMKF